MNLQTKYHGEQIVQEQDVVFFPQGLPGFKEETNFVLLAFPDNDVFFGLQSTQTPDLCFVVADPFSFFPDYSIELDDATIEALNIESEQNVSLLVILTVREPFSETTANLQAPVIINKQNQTGRQVILNRTNYQTRHSLFSQSAAQEG